MGVGRVRLWVGVSQNDESQHLAGSLNGCEAFTRCGRWRDLSLIPNDLTGWQVPNTVGRGPMSAGLSPHASSPARLTLVAPIPSKSPSRYRTRAGVGRLVPLFRGRHLQQGVRSLLDFIATSAVVVNGFGRSCWPTVRANDGTGPPRSVATLSSASTAACAGLRLPPSLARVWPRGAASWRARTAATCQVRAGCRRFSGWRSPVLPFVAR
jgi:hypothetical protein